MKHEKLQHPSQTTLRSKHAELLSDIELVAQRANAARRDPQEAAAGIVEAAEVAHLRLLAAWRDSRGGNTNNAFFDPLSKRLRRIIRAYRPFGGEPAKEPTSGWIYQLFNFEEIPFERLKPYFRASHVDDAIKISIELGMRDLPGVRIWREETEE
jgi:hypothetical protein